MAEDKLKEQVIEYQTTKDFEKLLANNIGLLTNIVNRMRFQPPISYPELMQQAVETFWQGAEKYKPSECKASTYFYNLIRFDLIHYIKENSRNVYSDDEDERVYFNDIDELEYDLPVHLDVYDFGFSDFENADFAEALQKLDTENRYIVFQSALYDRSFADIGREKGKSRECIRQKYNKAIKLIQDYTTCKSVMGKDFDAIKDLTLEDIQKHFQSFRLKKECEGID